MCWAYVMLNLEINHNLETVTLFSSGYLIYKYNLNCAVTSCILKITLISNKKYLRPTEERLFQPLFIDV